MLWRDIVDPSIVNGFDQCNDAMYGMLIAMERMVREILKDHLLDLDSKSYFNWLLSTIHQTRATLERELKQAKKKGGR